MKTLKDLFTEAERDCNYDNRNYYYKTLNKLYQDGLLSIFITKKGMVATSKTGFKYNFSVSVAGWTKRAYNKSYFPIEPLDILNVLSKLISSENVKSDLSLKYSFMNGCDCGRCGGNGFIKQFSHVCNGICFECYGIGKSIELKTVNI